MVDAEQPGVAFNTVPDADRMALYGLYRDYVTHEDHLINHRMGWFIQLHSFLIAAYMLVSGAMIAALSSRTPGMLTGFVCLVGVAALVGLAVVGLSSSRAALVSVGAALASIAQLKVLARAHPGFLDAPYRLPGLTGAGLDQPELNGKELITGLPTRLMRLWWVSFIVPFAFCCAAIVTTMATCRPSQADRLALCAML